MGKKVYVAGPYTKGDAAINVRNALVAANSLADVGLYRSQESREIWV